MRHTHIASRIVALAAGALLAALLSTTALFAADIIDDWATVKMPPKPELTAVTVDPKTTALLILDIGKGNCGVRPRCVATLPNVKKLHDAARAAGAMLWYTIGDPSELSEYFGVGFVPRTLNASGRSQESSRTHLLRRLSSSDCSSPDVFVQFRCRESGADSGPSRRELRQRHPALK